MVVPEPGVLTVPGEGLKFLEAVGRGQVLEEKGGGGEEGVTRPGSAGSDGGEVLEAGRVGDGDFLSSFLVDFLDEFEHAIVVHGHGFGADDVVGHAVVAAGVFDFLLDAKRPGRDGAEVVGFGFEGVLVGCVLEVA